MRGASYHGRQYDLSLIAQRRGIENPQFTYVRTLSGFWEGFFGDKDFCASVANRELPALVIATGEIRNYSYAGGETLDINMDLVRISNRWGVPLELINTPELITTRASYPLVLHG